MHEKSSFSVLGGVFCAVSIFLFVFSLTHFTTCKSDVAPVAKTPVKGDFDITGLTQTYDGSAKTVTITPKEGKSPGKISIFYDDSPNPPTEVGTYNVTFDVEKAKGWKAALGLSAGMMTIEQGGPRTPIAGDFTYSNMRQTLDDIVDVVITPQEGKSNGKITIYYENEAALPSTTGIYAVTFDVAADEAGGWREAMGLIAGDLEISEKQTPVANDYDISNRLQTAGSVTHVVIAAKSDKSSGEITIYYEGIGSTSYAKSTTIPQSEGSYAVTFNVAAGTYWDSASGLSAGTLTVNSPEYTPVKYKIYSNGTLTSGFSVQSGSTAHNLQANPGGARSGHTSALSLDDVANRFISIRADSATAVDWSTVDALSFWVKGSGNFGLVQVFGLLDDTGAAGDPLNVEHKGDLEAGVTVGNTWQQVLIPIPAKTVKGAAIQRAEVFKLWIASTNGQTLYLDDIELIVADKGLNEIVVPSTSKTINAGTQYDLSARGGGANSSIMGNYRAIYNVNGQTVPLFSANVGFENWFNSTYKIVSGAGNVTINGNKITATDNFSIAVEFDGRTSSTINVAVNKTPVAADFNYGNMTQSTRPITAVTITRKDTGKSGGTVSNIRYNGSTTVPQATDSYTVTFDVAAATGWLAANGLTATTQLVISNDTPKVGDYNISTNTTQTAESVAAVTVTRKDTGKSGGAVTVYYTGRDGTSYNKSTTVPQNAGSYSVTFDVAAAASWNAATNLSAGNLTVNKLTPVAGDYNIGNTTQTAGSVTAVTITPKANKSGGNRTIYYAGRDGTSYNKSTTLPTAAGSYSVTFDVAAAGNWNAAANLSAGNLTVNVARVQYKIYSNGTLTNGYQVRNDSTPRNMTSTNGGGHAGNQSIELLGGENWGRLLSIESINNNTVDWSRVQAVSLWVKGANSAHVASFGLLDDATQGQDTLNVEYKGGNLANMNAGFTLTNNWVNYIVPIPAANAKGTAINRKEVFKIFLASGENAKAVYIDDIELITVERSLTSIVIKSSATVNTGNNQSIYDIVGAFESVYTVDGKTVSLFSDAVKMGEWFNPLTFNVTSGNATIQNGDRINITGNFNLTLSFGGKTSNAITVTANAPNQTPVVGHYNFSNNLTQTAGSVSAVTVTRKNNDNAVSSPGAITVKYAGNTTLPTTAGTYAVTFDVASATGWNAATGLVVGTLTINAAVSSNVKYVVYSNGSYGSGFGPSTGAPVNSQTPTINANPNGGRNGHTVALGINDDNWGRFVSIRSNANLTWTGVEALSFWMKGDNILVNSIGLLDDQGSGQDPLNIEYKGEDGNAGGFTITNTWTRYVLPIPNNNNNALTNLNSHREVFKLYVDGGRSGKTIYVDDIELIGSGSGKSFTIEIPNSGSMSANSTTDVYGLLGQFKARYSIDGKNNILLFSNFVKFGNWFANYGFGATNGASISGTNVTSGTGNFNLTVTFGGVTSNNLVVTVTAGGTNPGGVPNVGDNVAGKGTLVWSDEFNGTSLDTNKWNYDYGAGGQYGNWGWGNGERQWYRPQNVRVSGGTLIIEASNGSPDGNYPYSSGKITTGGTRGAGTDGVANNQHFPRKNWYGIAQGYVEARIKTPKGAGYWPAFWMLGANFNGDSGHNSVGWPKAGEIDILETIGGQETTMHQTIHFGNNYNGSHWYITNTYGLNPGAGDGYRIYAVKWSGNGNTGTLQFLCDGTVRNTINFPGDLTARGGNLANPESFFDGVPWTIIFNLAIGGDMGGGLPSNDSLTNNNWEARSLMVDWVRVYQ